MSNGNGYHKNSVGHNNHAITANPDDSQTGYATMGAMFADTPFQITENINKVVRVERRTPADPIEPSFWVLVSIDPTVWAEFSNTGSDSLGDVLAVGNVSGPHDIIMNTGQAVQLPSAPVAGIDAANKDYVDSQIGANNDLSEILANGNTSGPNPIIMDAGQKITLPEAPVLGTDGANKDYVDAQIGANNDLSEILANGNTSGTTDILMDSGQGIAVGGAARTAETSIDLQASDQALLINRGTTAQRDALTPVEGMIYYNLDTHDLESYNNTVWESAAGGDVVGSSSSLDSQLTRYNGTSGKNIHPAPSTFIDDDGNLGIGIFPPTQSVRLHVEDTTTAVQRIKSATGKLMQFLVGTNGTIISSDTWLGLRAGSDNSLSDPSGDGIHIAANGRVGIGTTNPSAILQTHATSGEFIGFLASNAGGGSGAIYTDNSAGSDNLALYTDTAGGRIMTSTGNYLSFHTNCTTSTWPYPANEKMRITSDGDVGIGTTDPVSKLHIVTDTTAFGGSSGITMDNVNATGDAGMAFKTDSFQSDLWTIFLSEGDGAIKIGRNNTPNKLVIKDSGRIGINIADPITTLDVNSNAVGQGRVSTNETGVTGQNNPGFMLHDKGVFKGGIFYKEANDAVEIFDDSEARIHINNFGVGVGMAPNGLNQTFAVNGIVSLIGGANGHGMVQSQDNTLLLGNSTAPSLVGITDFKMGIGTNIPSSTLHVVGDAFIETHAHVWDYIGVGETLTGMANTSIGLEEPDQSLRLNNVSTVARDAYPTPRNGMFHQNTTLKVPEYYEDDAWRAVTTDSIVYVKTAADLPEPIAFVIYLKANTRYVGDNHGTLLTLDPLIGINFGENTRLEYLSLSMSGVCTAQDDFEFSNCLITYTGTETLLNMPALVGVSQVRSSTFTFTSSGTLFGLDSVTANCAVIMDTIGIVGSGTSSLGSVGGMVFSLTTGRALFFGTGLTLHDCTQIEIDKLITVGVNAPTTHITMNGTTQNNIQIGGFSPTVQSNEYGFDFQAGTAFNGVTSVSGCTLNDPARVFAPGSFDFTSLGFKFLGNANIPDSTANNHIVAINAIPTQTELSINRVARINANYAQASSERFDFSPFGDMQYTGNEAATFLLSSTITGTVSSGTNIPFNFYLAKNPSGLLIASIEEVSPTIIRIHTNIPHGWTTEDRIIFEDSIYDGQYDLFNPTSTTFEVFATFIGTSTGFPSRVLPETQASNQFSGSNGNTSVISVVPMEQGDIVFLGVENTGSNAEWDTDVVQAIMTKV